jgi:hypothetical protein
MSDETTTADTTETTDQTTTTEAPPTDIRQYLDEKGNFVRPGWSKLLEVPDTIEKKFKTLQGQFKSYVTLERSLGNSNKVAIPGDTATDEERSAFWGKIGRPATPDEYEFKAPDKLPVGVWDEAQLKEYAAFAHTLGLTRKQAQDLAVWQAQRIGSSMESTQQQQEQQRLEAEESLKKAWGPKYQYNLVLAKKAAQAVGGEELLAHPLASDPVFIRAMAKMGGMISETRMAGLRQEQGFIDGDPQAEIDKIVNDKASPYWVQGHPDHGRTVERVFKLREQKLVNAG